jgi:hypothetical protein
MDPPANDFAILAEIGPSLRRFLMAFTAWASRLRAAIRAARTYARLGRRLRATCTLRAIMKFDPGSLLLFPE